jgi:hypothetical protein
MWLRISARKQENASDLVQAPGTREGATLAAAEH